MAGANSHLTVYRNVFLALLVLTVITVSASLLSVGTGMAVSIALLIAAFKGSLVANYFMHLATERKLIHWVLLLTALFFLALIFIPLSDTLTNVGN